MARYFNKTRSPLTAPLRDGSTGYFASKKWVVVSKEKEGTAALLHLVKRGMLVRREEKAILPKVAPVAPPVAPLPVSGKTVEIPKPPPLPPLVVDVPAVDQKFDVSSDGTIKEKELVGEPKSESDHASPSSDVGENTVASEVSLGAESKSTRRLRGRKR